MLVRTTFTPWRETDVTPSEYLELSRLGLIFSGDWNGDEPGGDSGDPFDAAMTTVAQRPDSAFSVAQRAAFVPRDEYVPGGGGSGGLTAVIASTAPTILEFSFLDPLLNNFVTELVGATV